MGRIGSNTARPCLLQWTPRIMVQSLLKNGLVSVMRTFVRRLRPWTPVLQASKFPFSLDPSCCLLDPTAICRLHNFVIAGSHVGTKQCEVAERTKHVGMRDKL